MCHLRGALVAALVLTSAAPPAFADVGVLPIEVTSGDPQRTADLRSSLEIEIAEVLKRRQVRVNGARSCGDDFSARCAVDVAEATTLPLDEVALVSVEDRTGGGFVVNVTVRETGEGKRVFHQTVRQAPSDGPGVVASALRRAFDPRSWAGRIVVTGAPDDAEVLVDGLRVVGPTAARVGDHRVVVRAPDGAERGFDVEVEQGEVATVHLDAPASAAAPSGLPALVLGGLAAVGVGAAGAFGGLALWYDLDQTNVAPAGQQANYVDRQEFLARDARLGGAVAKVDPTGNRWLAGYGTAGGEELTQSARLAQRASAHGEMVADRALRDIYTAVAIGSGVVAAASVVGALVAWPEEPTEGGAPSAASGR
ncbi:MAG: hypothetical protein HYS27_19770 [Deltaproteobacteria bacterium]|nr:hypothetical protein [Deltaproteobacteria bacterium]